MRWTEGDEWKKCDDEGGGKGKSEGGRREEKIRRGEGETRREQKERYLGRGWVRRPATAWTSAARSRPAGWADSAPPAPAPAIAPLRWLPGREGERERERECGGEGQSQDACV